MSVDLEARFKAIKEHHPGSTTRSNDCRLTYFSLLAKGESIEKQADLLDASHAAWCRYWAASEVIPLGLLNWLAGGDALEQPPEVWRYASLSDRRNGRPKSKIERMMEEI